MQSEAHMRAYLQITGAVFGVMAVLHVMRLLLHWPAQIAGWTVPLWVSWVAVVADGALVAALALDLATPLTLSPTDATSLRRH